MLLKNIQTKCGQKILGVLSSLLYLANASGLASPLEKINDNIEVRLFIGITPTLSPKDPNFPTWWEQHKSEWEEKKKGGQEPADD